MGGLGLQFLALATGPLIVVRTVMVLSHTEPTPPEPDGSVDGSLPGQELLTTIVGSLGDLGRIASRSVS